MNEKIPGMPPLEEILKECKAEDKEIGADSPELKNTLSKINDKGREIKKKSE